MMWVNGEYRKERMRFMEKEELIVLLNNKGFVCENVN